MADITTLRALKARVDAATGADRELDALLVAHFDIRPTWLARSNGELWVRKVHGGHEVAFRDCRFKKRSAGDPPAWGASEVPSLTASIDAAVGLVERLKPGAWYLIETYGEPDDRRASAVLTNPDFSQHSAQGAKTIPLAIVGALLSALIAQAEAGAEESAAAATDGGER